MLISITITHDLFIKTDTIMSKKHNNPNISGVEYFKKYGIGDEIVSNITKNKGIIYIFNPYYKKNEFNPWPYHKYIIGAIFYVVIVDRSYTDIYFDNNCSNSFDEEFGINLKENYTNSFINDTNLKYIDFNISKKQMKHSKLYNSYITTPIKSNEIKHFYIVCVNKNTFTIIKDLWRSK